MYYMNIAIIRVYIIYTQCISIDCGGCVKKWMSSQEPLRILIFFFLSICGFSAPGFAPSNAAPWYFAVALVFAAVFGFLFLRERGKRTAQLVRLETWVGNGCGCWEWLKSSLDDEVFVVWIKKLGMLGLCRGYVDSWFWIIKGRFGIFAW